MNAEGRPQGAAPRQAGGPEDSVFREPSAFQEAEPVEFLPGAGVRLDLQRAIAAPGWQAHVIGADNTLVDVISRDAAVKSDACYCVDVRSSIIATDFDKADAESAAVTFAAAVRLLGLKAVVVQSGGVGRRHVFVRVPDGPTRERLKSLAKRLGADVRSRIRPPLTAHRTGEGRSTLLDPQRPEEALTALTERSNGRSVSDRLFKHIVEDASGYDSNSEAIMAAALSVSNIGFTLSDFEALLGCEGLAIATCMTERRSTRGDSVTARWLRNHVWPAAVKTAEESPAVIRRDPSLEAIRRTVLGPWEGRTASSDRAVMLAFLEVADRTGRLVIDLSVRDAADLANVATCTAQAAQKRLTEAGWITRVERGAAARSYDGSGHRLASTWRLNQVNWHQPRDGVASPACGPAHDVWRNRSGLGQSAKRVYDALEAGAATVVNVSESSGMKAPTVRKALKKLEGIGLTSRDGRSWQRLEVDLDLVAQDIGAAGCRQRQKDRHKAERHAEDMYWDTKQAAEAGALTRALANVLELVHPEEKSLISTHDSYTPRTSYGMCADEGASSNLLAGVGA